MLMIPFLVWGCILSVDGGPHEGQLNSPYLSNGDLISVITYLWRAIDGHYDHSKWGEGAGEILHRGLKLYFGKPNSDYFPPELSFCGLHNPRQLAVIAAQPARLRRHGSLNFMYDSWFKCCKFSLSWKSHESVALVSQTCAVSYDRSRKLRCEYATGCGVTQVLQCTGAYKSMVQ